MSTLGDVTNQDPAALALQLQQAHAQIDAMKGVVAGLSTTEQRKKRRKRKRQVAEDDDGASDAPSTTKAKATPPEHSQNFEAHGRKIMRLLGPFESAENIILHGLNADTALLGDESEDSTAEEKRLTESWNLLWQKFPGLHDLLLGIHKDLDLIESISRQINTGMEGVRGDDSGMLKARILSWISEIPPTATTIVAIPKSLRGFHDPAIAALLLPLEFKDNPDIPNPVELILKGELKITGRQLPCFLFPFGQADDVTALDTMGSGPIMLRTSKALFMGPSSALQGDGWHQGKPGNAVLIGLKTFTARVIAYVACQVRFNLSSQQTWNKADGHFDYDEFFWHIVEFFDEDTEFAARTIALYNRIVLGNASGMRTTEPTTGATPEMNHVQRLKAARAAAIAAAAAAPAA